MEGNMKTLIFGAGYLGSRMARELPNATLVKTDITDASAVRASLDAERPDVVINAAAKTGQPNVDWCEKHPIESFKVNVQGALNIAEACQRAGVYMTHLGSGCIFYGASPSPQGWREDDYANPESFYSRTKYAADIVLARLENTSVIRLRMPIDSVPSPRNLIDKIRKHKQVIDVKNSVTFVEDFMIALRAIITKRATGVFHVVNPEPVAFRNLLTLYKEIVDNSHTYELIDEEELLKRGLVTRKRSSCILATDRLNELGVSLRPSSIALRQTLTEYAKKQNL
jgi:dTDP-4-dehydrorhamnose reductase